jgi:CMP/dCMP kinase
MVVAIDGPAGTGKSSVSRCVAEHTGFFYINSGRFYRAITWKALQQGKNHTKPQALVATATDISIDIDRKGRFLVDGKVREKELHTSDVDQEVAAVSSIPEIRIAVNSRIKRIAGSRDIIVEGRDMSTVVFPDAEIKIYLDADAEERARRRTKELDARADYKEILARIQERDRIDRTKAVGSLRKSDDAEYVDTTHLTLDEVCEKVIDIIHAKTKHGRS